MTIDVILTAGGAVATEYSFRDDMNGRQVKMKEKKKGKHRKAEDCYSF